MSQNKQKLVNNGNPKNSKARGLMRRQLFYHSSPSYVSELWSGLSAHERWLVWKKVFSKMEQQADFTLHAFVMLGTHVHILFSTLQQEENFIMDSVHRELQKYFQHADVLEQPLLSEKIDSYQQLLNTYRYIYRNPVEAGVVEKVEDYPYSSLFIQLGGRQSFSSVMDPMNLIQHPTRILNWLNQQEGNLLYKGFRNRQMTFQMRQEKNFKENICPLETK